MSEFPQKLGFLTFVREFVDVKKKRVGVYLCSCGKEVEREFYNAQAAKLRSSYSACPKCRRANNRKGRGVRVGGFYG